MADNQWSLVAVPRRWVKDWTLELIELVFGEWLMTKQPLRWILMREVTAREMDKIITERARRHR
jgi:hypothetical protein